MIYVFECEPCELSRQVDSKPFNVPPAPLCVCGKFMDRVYGCQIDTSGCKDHDHIPESKRVARSSGPADAAREEARFNSHINERRKLYSQHGQGGSFRHTHSIPADLYHGKIRETGDRSYWQDPKNLNRHKSTKVS